MKTLAGLFLIAMDAIRGIGLGIFNPSREDNIFSIILAAAIMIGIYLTAWLYLPWLAALVISIATMISFGIISSGRNACFQGYSIVATGIFIVGTALWAMIYLTTYTADREYISSITLTKENYKDEKVIIKVKGEEEKVHIDNGCALGDEMRIYLGTKPMYFLGNCDFCESYKGSCKPEIKREIVEVQ